MTKNVQCRPLMIKNKNILVDVSYLNADVVREGGQWDHLPHPYPHFLKVWEERVCSPHTFCTQFF
jgi:hypothetical protein